ncbi:hypothetical protein CKAN_01065500 [Cinnamomum micranthum f. kanehirae]|uniref:Transmembrane protein n=1 Tax=Cinnamomum micranthum f. kanehirae TaxID=337451 RepID=A0A3S3P395_9MAGN|nr:hypothetical protein CKAN_01065500 [Cinnamomum micranthum f. kanehirae]
MEFIADEEFQHLSLASILKHSIAIIPKSSPKTFFFITLSFILPLSLTFLGYAYLIYHLVDHWHLDPSSFAKSQYFKYTLILFYQFLYLLFVFAFSLLSTSTSIFSVASIYTSNSTSFSSTISAIPSILPRLFCTFVWFSLLALVYNAVLYICAPVILLVLSETRSIEFCIAVFFALFSSFLLVHVYLMSVWQLASVVSVLEPTYGLGAMKRSRVLLHGKMMYASVLVLGYMFMWAMISLAFAVVVVHGEEYEIGLWVRILVGVVLVVVLVALNLVGLIAQNVFYFVCKSFHLESIDKSVLIGLLEGYVKVHVKVNSMA